MSNILEMLKNEKVEWKKLGEVAKISKGKQFNKKDMLENGKHPVINGGIFPSGYIDMFNSTENTITVSQGGASAGFVNFIEEKFWLGAHAFSLIPNNDIIKNYNYDYSCFNRFLFHMLKMNQSKLQDSKIGAGIPSISKDYLSSIEIPLTSKETQAEIVKILDTFTELIKELKNELNLRKKQYSYYRDKLLSEDYLNKHEFGENVVEWKKLGEISQYSKERILATELNSDNYVGVENLLQNRNGKTKANYTPSSGSVIKFNKYDILIGNIRPYLKKIWISDCIGGTNGDVLVIQNINDSILNKYLYYILSSDDFFNYDVKYSKGGKMPRGDKIKIMEYKIPIPSLEVQEHVVSILDKFDTLVNDISDGLPKEIEFRTKQYEHYREKLLTFNKD